MKEIKIVSFSVEKDIVEDFDSTIKKVNATSKRDAKKLFKGHVIRDFMVKFINKNK